MGYSDTEILEIIYLLMVYLVGLALSQYLSLIASMGLSSFNLI